MDLLASHTPSTSIFLCQLITASESLVLSQGPKHSLLCPTSILLPHCSPGDFASSAVNSWPSPHAGKELSSMPAQKFLSAINTSHLHPPSLDVSSGVWVHRQNYTNRSVIQIAVVFHLLLRILMGKGNKRSWKKCKLIYFVPHPLRTLIFQSHFIGREGGDEGKEDTMIHARSNFGLAYLHHGPQDSACHTEIKRQKSQVPLERILYTHHIGKETEAGEKPGSHLQSLSEMCLRSGDRWGRAPKHQAACLPW